MCESLCETDEFHKSFKFHKNNKNVICSEILDFDHLKEPSEVYKSVQLTEPSKKYLNLRPFTHWKAYELTHNPGFVVIKNAISSKLEKELVRKTLKEFTKPSHVTNLSPYTNKEDIENIWQNYKKEDGGKKLLNKLRWITFGYHHNWDSKVYSEQNKSEVSLDVKDLCRCLGESIGYNGFEAEAGIINIYHHNSSLAGHVDNSEKEINLPLISISLGCTGVFLIGGRDKNTTPTALLLKSRDIVIMSGESRHCYHALPRIIPYSYKPHEEAIDPKDGDGNDSEGTGKECDEVDDEGINKFECEEWRHMVGFLKQSRINFNIRQVMK